MIYDFIYVNEIVTMHGFVTKRKINIPYIKLNSMFLNGYFTSGKCTYKKDHT